jgi:hypothetical protein
MIAERIQRFVETGEGNFNSLALAVFAHQHEQVEAVRRLCESRGVTPAAVTSWRRVPAVPVAAFKTLELAAAPAREVFRSSGTGGGPRSVHHHPFPDLYRRVIAASFPRWCLAGLEAAGPEGPPLLALIPDRGQLPDSSLSFMIDHVLGRFGGPGSRWAFGPRRVELPAARSWLGARQRDGRPGLVLATAFALAELVDGLERLGLRFRLPPGSAVFETGGFKGRTREIPRAELLARLAVHLGVAAARVVSEYGMTELTSQCYTQNLVEPEAAAGRVFVPPPWMRVRVLDPETLEEAPAGVEGLLAFFDLANVGSVAHVLTEDLGRAVPGEAPGGFELVGRAAGAELRGCSLVVEEMAD